MSSYNFNLELDKISIPISQIPFNFTQEGIKERLKHYYKESIEPPITERRIKIYNKLMILINHIPALQPLKDWLYNQNTSFNQKKIKKSSKKRKSLKKRKSSSRKK